MYKESVLKKGFDAIFNCREDWVTFDLRNGKEWANYILRDLWCFVNPAGGTVKGFP